MADNRITRKRLKNHFVYGWWKYLLAVVLCVMGVDLIFSMTAYRPPEDKKIELYMCNGYANTELLREELWPVLVERYPQQEELTVLNIDLTSGDIYAPMQFSTYIAAQQGDVCLLPRSEVEKLTADGADSAFVELTPYLENGVIDASGVELEAGMYRSEAGETGLYAIPTDSLYGLLDYGCDPAGGMLCIMAFSGNQDTAAGVVGMLLDMLSGEAPEVYEEEETPQSTQQIFR